MNLKNATSLETDRLAAMFEQHLDGWPHRALAVRICYSRSRPFSGLCDYRRKRIHVNIGRDVSYPYDLATRLARARSNARYWWKEIYRVRIADSYQLALFIFLHELYHWLVKQAGQNTRRKESMCDRFAARVLVEQCGAVVLDRDGKPVERAQWDFQDLDRFVARARRLTRAERSARCAAAARAACSPIGCEPPPAASDGQLLLFPLDEGASLTIDG